MQKKKKPKKENSERWLLTYSDLITLLMIFFILLYTMSNISKGKFEELSKSLNNAMGNGTSNSVIDGSTGVLPNNGSLNKGENINKTTSSTTPNTTPTATPTSSATPSPQVTSTLDSNGKLSGYIRTQQDMKHLQEYFNKILRGLKMTNYVTTEVRPDGLVTTFSNDVFFDSGDDSLKLEMITGLKKLAPLLSSIDNTILVEGYTDTLPVSKYSKFASNWQLSSARASNVVQYLVDKCGLNGNHLSAVGYGQYHPQASNATEQGRSKNRRIEIIILYN